MANKSNNNRNRSKQNSKPSPRYNEAMLEAYGIKPNKVKGIFNARTEYYMVELQKMALPMVDVEYNDEIYRWDKDYIREGLLIKGYFTVTKDNNGNLLPLKCGSTGINVFNRVTTAIIANPVVGSFNRTIGVDCELVYLHQKQGGRFRSLYPTIQVFAQKLANCDAAIDINLFNSRTPYIFQAPSQEVADSFKAMYDEITEGNPAVFIDEQMGSLLQNQEGSNLYVFKAKENFIADQVQIEKQMILSEFLTKIGINSANTSKKERLITDEVNSNNEEIQINIKLWKQNVEECVDRVNKMFPDANLKITFPYYKEAQEVSVGQPTNEEGGESNESNR